MALDGAFLALFYSPPVIVILAFFLSIVFICLLATAQLAYTVIIGTIYLFSSSLYAKEIIQKIVNTIRYYFPETISMIEENIRKTYICNKYTKAPGLYIWHPHGLFASAPYIHAGLGLGTNSPKMKLATLSLFFRIPIVKDIANYVGMIDAEYKTLHKKLMNNEQVSLVVGGVEEMFHSTPKKLKLCIKNRSGYLRLALETKQPIFPVITYGENEIFESLKEYTNTKFNRFLKKYLGIIIPVSSIQSLVQWSELSKKPMDKLNTFIGDPVYPSENDSLESLREKYLQSIYTLFETTHPEGYEIEII
jgi:hypothetical protein